MVPVLIHLYVFRKNDAISNQCVYLGTKKLTQKLSTEQLRWRVGELQNLVRSLFLNFYYDLFCTTMSAFIYKSIFLNEYFLPALGGELSPVLQEVFMSVFDSQVCDRSYSDLHFYEQVFPDKIKTENLVCAGHVDGGRDACSVSHNIWKSLIFSCRPFLLG